MPNVAEAVSQDQMSLLEMVVYLKGKKKKKKEEETVSAFICEASLSRLHRVHRLECL